MREGKHDVPRWLIGALLVAACSCANAHDLKRADLDAWFEGLHSIGSGHCCEAKEAQALDDSDWDTKDNHYRVRLNGNWYDVPDNSVVKEPNLAGHALLWVNLLQLGGVPTIRCFLPGTWS
jgi:hypothetical protein